VRAKEVLKRFKYGVKVDLDTINKNTSCLVNEMRM